jgi:hypothetical protein
MDLLDVIIKSESKGASFLFKYKATYRVTSEDEIQSHIKFTPLHDHQVCLDTYHSHVSTCHGVRRKNVSWAHDHFMTSFRTCLLA